MSRFKLPILYAELDWLARKEVREQYIEQQGGVCFHCGVSLHESPPSSVTDKPINWSLFPPGFLKYPIHLQHCHRTGLTEGAVHSYCNAVMWQYEQR